MLMFSRKVLLSCSVCLCCTESVYQKFRNKIRFERDASPTFARWNFCSPSPPAKRKRTQGFIDLTVSSSTKHTQREDIFKIEGRYFLWAKEYRGNSTSFFFIDSTVSVRYSSLWEIKGCAIFCSICFGYPEATAIFNSPSLF